MASDRCTDSVPTLMIRGGLRTKAVAKLLFHLITSAKLMMGKSIIEKLLHLTQLA